MANIVPIQPKDTLKATRDAVVNRQFSELNQDIVQHKASNQAHDATAIKYSGAVVGVENTKQAIDNIQTQVNTLVLNGDSSVAAAQAAVDANGHNYGNLKTRLDTEHTTLSEQLADIAIVNVSPFCVGDGITDDTLGLQTAVNAAEGKRLLLPPDYNCLITDSIVLPRNIIFDFQGGITMDGDVDYWFDGRETDTFIIDSFFGKLMTDFSSRTKLNRILFADTSSHFRAKNVYIEGASTAIHCLNGDEFFSENVILKNVYGVEGQYGYGINTSAKRSVIKNTYVENDDNSHGRHAIYINGSQLESVVIDNVKVINWNQNPINYTNTNSLTKCTYSVKGDIYFENCNVFTTSDPRGCIHGSNSNGNAGVKVAIGLVKVKNIYGPAVAFLSTGYDNLELEGVHAYSLPDATNANTALVHLRGGKNQRVGMIYCEELNTNWLAALYFRQSENCTFDSVYVKGNSSQQAVRLLDCTDILIGNIYADGVVKTNLTNSTVAYKALMQKITYGNNIPTSGNHTRGDIHWNSVPSLGNPTGWICVISGSPGTWQPFGLNGLTKLASQSDSTATDVSSLKTDFNNLLAKLRNAGLM